MDHVHNLLMKFKDRMSISSYDELIKHVESLKVENSHLKQELQDNSSHLSKLENEASNMKDVLSHLHSAMEQDLDQTLTLEDLLAYTNDKLDHNSNNSTDESQSDTEVRQAHCNLLHDQAASVHSVQGLQAAAHKAQNNSPLQDGSPSKKRMVEREYYTYIQELDQERTSILNEVESEERHRKWYYEQLEALNNKIDTLPLSDQYNLQTDMTRRQLEYEVQRIRDLMHENLGSTEHIAQRHEARLQRIRVIEAEMVRLQQCHREQLEQEKRDSGTCDHNEGGDGLVVMDAATNTVDCGETDVNMPDNSCLYNGSSSSISQNLSTIFHGAWPIEKGFGGAGDSSLTGLGNPDTASVMSFNSSNASSGSRRVSNQQLGTKVTQ